MSRSLPSLMKSAVPGFLADTPVLTSSGYKPISTIVVGDTVISSDGTTDKVSEIKKWECIACAETLPYHIPKGFRGAKEDIYLSPIQRIAVGADGMYRESNSIGGPIVQATMEEGTQIEYYNIRLTSKNEYTILVGGIGAEPLPVNECIEVSAEEFRVLVHDRYGSRPDDKVLSAIFKVCKRLPNGMIQIPMFMTDVTE